MKIHKIISIYYIIYANLFFYTPLTFFKIVFCADFYTIISLRKQKIRFSSEHLPNILPYQNKRGEKK